MGSFCTSGPSKTETKQTQTYQADPRVAAAGEQTLNMAQGAASQPFQTPAAPVAGFNPFQQQAFGQIQGMQGALAPYFQNASSQMNTAGAPITEADINANMNPYAGQALDNMKKYVFDPQRRNTMGNAVQTAGGIGADRLALTSQNLDKTQADALGQAQAGFYGQALSAAQQSKQQALQSAQGWANLGLGNQSGQLQATGALAGAGAQQQQQTQRELMSPYEQRLAEIAYPMQQASFLSGITGNMSNVFKGTSNTEGTQTNYAAQPSMFNQIAGLGMSAAGLAMGMPGLGTGGMGMFNSIPAMWGGFQSTQNQGFGNSAAMGGLGYDSGGAVNPWDIGQGYAPGGDVEEYSEDQFNPIDAASVDYSRPLERPAPNLGMWPFNRGRADYKGDVTMFPATPSGAQAAPAIQSPMMPQEEPSPPPATPAPQPPMQSPQPNPWGVPDNAGTLPMPGAYTRPLPPGSPPPLPPPPTAIARAPQSQDRSGPYRQPSLVRDGNINSDMKVGDMRMPRGEMPYPDSTERDWGQNLTRSPWMSLVSAGAKMAQSTKSGAAGLAEGVEAGVNHLDKQRGELRSEEQINQKAESLYQHAKAELNKYTRKTPHQLATEQESTRYHNIVSSLGQSKIENQMATGNLIYAGPVKDQPGMGYFYDKKRLGADGQPSVFIAPFDPGEKPGTAAKSGKVAAHELYKKLYPEDPKGAQDILLGHKTMTRDDARKRVEAIVTKAMQAQPIQPGTSEWLEEHKRRSDEMMAKVKEEYGL